MGVRQSQLDAERSTREEQFKELAKSNQVTQQKCLDSMQRFAEIVIEQTRISEKQMEMMSQFADRPTAIPRRSGPRSLLHVGARYSMEPTGSHVGTCLIIDNENFLKSEKRIGTTRDSNRLSDVFSNFGFETVEKKDLTAANMASELENLSKKDNNGRLACCVVIILSHGSQEGITGTDELLLPLSNIWHPFTDDKAAWKGRPKVFIIQACQGRKEMGNRNKFFRDARPFLSFPVEPPSHADIFICCSTVTGYTSVRKEDGSVYIKTFVNTLRDNYKEEDLESMVTTVHRKVAEIEDFQQQPFKSSTLRKKIYFCKPN